MPNVFNIECHFDTEQDCYVATVDIIFGACVTGETYEDARAKAKELADNWLAWLNERNAI